MGMSIAKCDLVTVHQRGHFEANSYFANVVWYAYMQIHMRLYLLEFFFVCLPVCSVWGCCCSSLFHEIPSQSPRLCFSTLKRDPLALSIVIWIILLCVLICLHNATFYHCTIFIYLFVFCDVVLLVRQNPPIYDYNNAINMQKSNEDTRSKTNKRQQWHRTQQQQIYIWNVTQP